MKQPSPLVPSARNSKTLERKKELSMSQSLQVDDAHFKAAVRRLSATSVSSFAFSAATGGDKRESCIRAAQMTVVIDGVREVNGQFRAVPALVHI